MLLDKLNLVPAFGEVASNHINDNEVASVANVEVIVYCGAAIVHANMGRIDRLKVFLLASEGIIYLHDAQPFIVKNLLDEVYAGER